MADQSNVVLQIIARLRDELSAPLANVKKALTGIKPDPIIDVGKATHEAAAGAGELSSAMGEILKTATGFSAGFGAVEVLKKLGDVVVEATTQVLEFEHALHTVRITSDDTGVHLQSFEDSLRGLSTQFGVSAEEIAGASGLIAQLTGLRAAEGITKFEEAALNLSKLGLGDLRQSISLTANVLNAFGLDATQAESTMLKVWQAARLGKVPFADLASTLEFTGAAAHTVGVKVDELAVFISKLTENGVRADQASFALRNFLIQISNPSDAARQKIEHFAGSLDEALKSATPLAAVLAQMQKFVPPEEFNTIFGSARTGTVLRNLAQNDLPAVLDEINKVGPQSQAAFGKLDEVLGTTEEKLKRIKEQFKNGIGADIGNEGQKALSGLLENLNLLTVDSKKGAFQSWRENVQREQQADLKDALALWDESSKRLNDMLARSVAINSAEIADGLHQTSTVASSVAADVAKVSDVLEHVPKLDEVLGVKQAEEEIRSLTQLLKGADFHGILSADQVPEDVRAQFEGLQKLVQNAAAGNFHKPDTQDAANIKAVEDRAKALKSLFDTVRKAQEANLPAQEKQLAALDDQIAATRDLLTERTKLFGAEIANAQTNAQVAALEETAGKLRTSILFKEQNQVLGLTDSTRGLLTAWAGFSAQVAIAGVNGEVAKRRLDLQVLLNQAEQLRLNLSHSPLAGVQQPEIDLSNALVKIDKDQLAHNITAAVADTLRLLEVGGAHDKESALSLDLALRPRLDIDAEKLKEQIRQGAQPAIDAMLTELHDIAPDDPQKITKEIALLDRLTETVQKLGRGMHDTAEQFREGFGAGIQDEIDKFTNQAQQGYQFAQTAVESFTNATAKAIQGLVEGTAHLRDLLRGFLSDVAAALSQLLANRLVGQLLGAFAGGGTSGGFSGLFGVPGVSKADGGLLSGGLHSFAGGGVAYGPQLAMLGDNRAQVEAIVPLPGAGRGIPVEFKNGGGGTVVNVTYAPQVTTMDARGVRDVLTEHGRVVGDIVASQLGSGSHAPLRDGVRRAAR